MRHHEVYRDGWGAGHWFLGMLCVAALAALVVLLVTWAMRRHDDRNPSSPPAAGWGAPPAPGAFQTPGAMGPALAGDPAVAHTRMRYARGELTRDQYAQVMADLGLPLPASFPAATPDAPAMPPTAPTTPVTEPPASAT